MCGTYARMAKQFLLRFEQIETALVDEERVIERQSVPWAHQLELLQTIPGVGLNVAQAIIAETGGDMSKFPTVANLASWAGVEIKLRRRPQARRGEAGRSVTVARWELGRRSGRSANELCLSLDRPPGLPV